MRPPKLLGFGFALATLASLVSGCAGWSAQRMAIDRSDFSQRLRESEKEQLLTNVVALRYGDAPLFLNVTSVISQYTREGSANGSVTFDPGSDSDGGLLSGGVLLRETPTVTYTPLAGERFSRSILAPLPPASLLSMMEAGWAADLLFRLSARSINGVSNSSRAPLFAHDADPDFEPVVAAIRRLQRSEALSVRLRLEDGVFTAEGRVRADLRPEEKADHAFVMERLRLKPGQGGLRIVFAAYPRGDDELAIATRSMFEVLVELSQCIALEDAAALSPDAAGAVSPALMRIHSGQERPPDAHVAVRYRDRWFWIDANDEYSKQMFMLAQIMMSLTDTGSSSGAPLVTIPAG